MSNQKKIGLLMGIILIMVLVVWLFSGGEEQNSKKEIFRSSNWSKKFQIDDRNPLGSYLIHSLLRAHVDSSRKIMAVHDSFEFDSIVSKPSKKWTFFFIGNNFGLQSSEMDTILERVKTGSELFISYNNLTDNLYEKLFVEYEELYDYDDHINLFTRNKKFKMYNIHQNDTVACNWKAFGDIEPIGNYSGISSFMEMNNFIRIKHGKGSVLLHSTPSLYYNYQVKRPEGYAYSRITLNEIDKNQPVLLLEMARLSDNYGNEDVDTNEGTEGKTDTSYLKIIFENPSLLTAFLLGIGGLLLFLLFRTKRTRPVVEFLGTKKDMTLAYAETITSIYFAKRNPYGILHVQKKNFYDTVQKHFFIDIQHRQDERPLIALAEKSNTSYIEIKQLVQELETKEAFSVNDQFTANMAKKVHAFYRNAGIISDKLQDRISERESVFRRALLLPFLMISGGIMLIITGSYFLVSAVGSGIVLWPIGLTLFLLGVIRVSKPYLVVDKDHFIKYNETGRRKEFNKKDLTGLEMKNSGVLLRFTENRQLIINFREMSHFDRKQFQRFISGLDMNHYDK